MWFVQMFALFSFPRGCCSGGGNNPVLSIITTKFNTKKRLQKGPKTSRKCTNKVFCAAEDTPSICKSLGMAVRKLSFRSAKGYVWGG
jgi:hypothetical protein